MEEIREYLPLLLPLFIIQLTLMIVALVDLIRRENVLGGNKLLWGVVIVLVGFFGPILYLAMGRRD